MRRKPVVVREDVDAILGVLFDIRKLLADLVQMQGEEEGDDDDT